MSSFLERKLAANRLLMESETDEIMPEINLGGAAKPVGDDLLIKMHAVMASAAREDLEQVPRKTLVKMFKDIPLEEKFTFKVELGGGANYVQAMRQVLSRVRKKAAAQKMELEDFKLFELGIESKEDHDAVTLIRSAVMTQKEESVYTELMSTIQVNLKPKK